MHHTEFRVLRVLGRLRVFGLILFLQMATAAFAQTDDNMPRRLTISGQLIDAEFGEPMAQATIQLFTVTDSVFVGGTVSDNRGNFSVEAPNNGTFRLKISSVGFQTIQRDVTLRRGQNQELGTLLMSPESIMLKEAVITGRAAQVIVKKDTLVFNPDAYRTPEGSAIEELIKRMMHRAQVENRADDTPEVFENRLKEYEEKTFPVMEHYQNQGKVMSISGVGSIEEIFVRLAEKIDSLL